MLFVSNMQSAQLHFTSLSESTKQAALALKFVVKLTFMKHKKALKNNWLFKNER